MATTILFKNNLNNDVKILEVSEDYDFDKLFEYTQDFIDNLLHCDKIKLICYKGGIDENDEQSVK